MEALLTQQTLTMQPILSAFVSLQTADSSSERLGPWEVISSFTLALSWRCYIIQQTNKHIQTLAVPKVINSLIKQIQMERETYLVRDKETTLERADF